MKKLSNRKKLKRCMPERLKRRLRKMEDQVKYPFRHARALGLRKKISLTKRSANFVAHRGLSAAAPENTVEAFRLAAQSGFVCMETDIRRTKDHKLVLMHDENLLRMCGRDVLVRNLTYQELSMIPVTGGKQPGQAGGPGQDEQAGRAGQDEQAGRVGQDEQAGRIGQPGQREENIFHIPLLKDYLIICRDGGMVPMMELKDNWNLKEALADDYLADILDQVTEVMEARPVIFVSFNLRSLRALQRLVRRRGLVQVSFFHIMHEIDLAHLPWYKKHGIHISFQGKNNKLATIRKAKKAGVRLVVWVVDDPDQARLYIREKVDWIASNGKVWEE